MGGRGKRSGSSRPSSAPQYIGPSLNYREFIATVRSGYISKASCHVVIGGPGRQGSYRGSHSLQLEGGDSLPLLHWFGAQCDPRKAFSTPVGGVVPERWACLARDLISCASHPFAFEIPFSSKLLQKGAKTFLKFKVVLTVNQSFM